MTTTVENINNEEYDFSEAEIESLMKIRQDFIDGKTTTRSWEEVEEELNQMYGK